VLRSPSRHKQNQQVMNDWQSTSISRKLLSENLAGEGGLAFWQSQSGEGKVDPRLQLPPALGCEFGLDLEVAFGLSFGGRAFGALDCASAETGSKPT
jgi:hypothetical protein